MVSAGRPCRRLTGLFLRSAAGLNGAVNGGSSSSSSRGGSVPSTPRAPGLSERISTPTSAGRTQKSGLDGGQGQEKHGRKTKDKVPRPNRARRLLLVYCTALWEGWG